MSESTAPSGIIRACPHCNADTEAPTYAVEDDGSEAFNCHCCGKTIVCHVTTVVKIVFAKPKRLSRPAERVPGAVPGGTKNGNESGPGTSGHGGDKPARRQTGGSLSKEGA